MTRACAVLAAVCLLAATEASAQDTRFHLRGALTYDDSGDTRLSDRACDPAPLLNFFGCQPGTDGAPIGAPGHFGTSPGIELAAGARALSFLRVELAVSHRRGLAFEGNATFVNAGDDQPANADLTQTGITLRGLVDLARLTPFLADSIEPFAAAGFGGSRNRINEVVYEFPALASQPATTTTPGSAAWSAAWDVGVGAAVRVAPRLFVEGAYRYSDFGEVRTAAGTIEVVRGSRVLVIDNVAGTHASLTSHGLYVGLRWGLGR